MVFVAVLCFIIPSIIWGLFLVAFRLRSKETIGTIIGEDTAHVEQEHVYAPIVEFQLPDGRKITFTEKTHTNENILDILFKLVSRFIFKRDPNKVKVLYDPKDPQKARVNAFTYLYSMPVILFAIGLCMMLYTIPMIYELLQPIIEFVGRFAKLL